MGPGSLRSIVLVAGALACAAEPAVEQEATPRATQPSLPPAYCSAPSGIRVVPVRATAYEFEKGPGIYADFTIKGKEASVRIKAEADQLLEPWDSIHILEHWLLDRAARKETVWITGYVPPQSDSGVTYMKLSHVASDWGQKGFSLTDKRCR